MIPESDSKLTRDERVKLVRMRNELDDMADRIDPSRSSSTFEVQKLDAAQRAITAIVGLRT